MVKKTLTHKRKKRHGNGEGHADRAGRGAEGGTGNETNGTPAASKRNINWKNEAFGKKNERNSKRRTNT